MMTNQPHETLNELLRGEIAATETYVQAIEKFDGPEKDALTQIKSDHIDACNSLRGIVHEQSGTPDNDSGVWGAWSKFVEGTAKTFGKTAALKVLKEGEEHGLHDYERLLATDSVNGNQQLFTQLLRQGEAHIATLNRFMDNQTRSAE